MTAIFISESRYFATAMLFYTAHQVVCDTNIKNITISIAHKVDIIAMHSTIIDWGKGSIFFEILRHIRLRSVQAPLRMTVQAFAQDDRKGMLRMTVQAFAQDEILRLRSG